MNESASSAEKSAHWYQNLSYPLWLIAIFLVVATLTRLALIVIHFNDISGVFYMIPVSLILGVVIDLFIALCVTLPVALFMLVFPVRWRDNFIIRWLASTGAGIFAFGLLYLGVTELFYFQEFTARFNYIAVDYLIYPHEVFVNIWDTYPVLTALIGTALSAILFVVLANKHLQKSILFPKSIKTRAFTVMVYIVLIAAGAFGLGIDSSRISQNRILNEITENGIYTFVYAGLTNELDYNQYYSQMDKHAAMTRLRELLKDDHCRFLPSDSGLTINRLVTSDSALHRYNIVLVLEESFGSKYIGKLHPEGPALTPRFDSLCDAHGLLFTHVYATGNRTVRGLEAALASFPPIPGRSIVKRPDCENVFTLSSLLREKGYSTVFLYGGLSYFDNFGEFARTNGFDRVIDELDFKNPTFKTVWGVSDEDLFGKAITTFDSLDALKKPFFATMVTVSNHTPYTYPAGRIPYDPEARTRDHVFRYADWAIGNFLEQAQSHQFYDSTLFVFMADHGARVYGSEQIPMKSYEIPVLFYNPVLIPKGETVGVLGSQLDVAPTILDFLGFDYNSEFFGRSLLSTPPDRERALISHDRDVALLKDSVVAVLGIQKREDIWRLDMGKEKLVPAADMRDSSLIKDAIAYYMIAYDMYRSRRLHPLKQVSTAQ